MPSYHCCFDGGNNLTFQKSDNESVCPLVQQNQHFLSFFTCQILFVSTFAGDNLRKSILLRFFSGVLFVWSPLIDLQKICGVMMLNYILMVWKLQPMVHTGLGTRSHSLVIQIMNWKEIQSLSAHQVESGPNQGQHVKVSHKAQQFPKWVIDVWVLQFCSLLSHDLCSAIIFIDFQRPVDPMFLQ